MWIVTPTGNVDIGPMPKLRVQPGAAGQFELVVDKDVKNDSGKPVIATTVLKAGTEAQCRDARAAILNAEDQRDEAALTLP